MVGWALAAAFFACALLLPVRFGFAAGFQGGFRYGGGVSLSRSAAQKRAERNMARGRKKKKRFRRIRGELARRAAHLALDGKIEEIRLAGQIDLGDAAKTAVAFGAAESFLRALSAARGVRILGGFSPGFSGGGMTAQVTGVVAYRFGVILYHAFLSAVSHIRRKRRNGKASD